MTLDEAIKHCEEIACNNTNCALEHKQLGKWLTELKELKEQKPAWSEEDEKMLKLSLENLTELKNNYGKEYGKVGDCIAWLKSIKPNHWKPSEEQMQALFEAKLASTKNREYFLGLLYEDLKNFES